MTIKKDESLRTQIKQLTVLETVTNSNTTYHVVGRYNCDICGKAGAICIRDRGRDLYSRCGCGVDARPSLIVQRFKLNMCLLNKAPQQPAEAQALPVPAQAAHIQHTTTKQPKNLLEYLMNIQIIPT